MKLAGRRPVRQLTFPGTAAVAAAAGLPAARETPVRNMDPAARADRRVSASLLVPPSNSRG